MCNPTQDGSSIDNAANFNSGLDVHFSSGVMNKAFCRAAKRLSNVSPDTGTATADGVKKAAKAWFTANATKWTTSATFVQGCQGVVDAAKALGYSTADVAALGASWADVGVTCSTGCTPQCSGKACGADGCGGTCGTCGPNQTCNSSGQCTGSCTPSCSGKTCGSDGCGGSCGTCGPGQTCGSNGTCSGGGTQCAHDLCTAGGKLASNCDACVTKICASDSYCCTTSWDNQCIGEVKSICADNRCSGGTTCAHDKCTAGTKLVKTCDACVTKICNADTYCCATKWDSQCVGEVSSVCGQSCP
jgi:hypothetical protein